MWRVAMLAGLTLAAGLAAFVSPIRGQTNEDVDHCYKEISPDPAIEYCTRAIGAEQLPSSSRAILFTNRGNAYNSKGDYDRAIQDFSEAVRLDPNCAYAFNGLGNSHNAEGAYDQAIQDYNNAIRLIPGYGYAFNGRGNAYNSEGDYDRAIQDYDQAIRFTPNYANAFNGRGNAYTHKGGYDRAIEDFNQAIRVNPNYANAFNGPGNAYNDKGDFDRAIQDYGEAIRLKPNYAEAFFNRGNAYNSKDDYDRAIENYDQTIELTPDFADAFFNRAFTRFKKGPVAEAVADFAKSAELAPASRYNILWLYVATARAGQNADAVLGNAQRLDLASWPGPVLFLFLKKTDRNALLAAASDPDAQKQRDRQCEAHFFLAEYELSAGSQKAAEADFQEAAATCRPTVVEYSAAAAELKRLPPPSRLDATQAPDAAPAR